MPYIDTDGCPDNRGNKVLCLNCGGNWGKHRGWACDQMSLIRHKSKLSPSKCYLTPDMQTASPTPNQGGHVPIKQGGHVPIKQGDKLPPFPFKVVCVDNQNREKELVVGQTYTVLRNFGIGSRIAYSDFLLQEVNDYFAILRFSILTEPTKQAPTQSTQPTTSKDLSDWKTWRDVNRIHMHCPCGIFEEDCRYHKEQ